VAKTGDTSAYHNACRVGALPGSEDAQRRRRSLETPGSCGTCIPICAPVACSPTEVAGREVRSVSLGRAPQAKLAAPSCLRPRLRRNEDKEAGSVNTPPPLQQFRRWSKFSSVVETRVTSPVRRCGNDERSRVSAAGNRWQSRRHLECRSFNQNGGPLHPG
jgi:hypothetical protein